MHRSERIDLNLTACESTATQRIDIVNIKPPSIQPYLAVFGSLIGGALLRAHVPFKYYEKEGT